MGRRNQENNCNKIYLLNISYIYEPVLIASHAFIKTKKNHDSVNKKLEFCYQKLLFNLSVQFIIATHRFIFK